MYDQAGFQSFWIEHSGQEPCIRVVFSRWQQYSCLRVPNVACVLKVIDLGELTHTVLLGNWGQDDKALIILIGYVTQHPIYSGYYNSRN